MPADTPKITRALVSVSDKTGLIDLARALTSRGVELLSTGGTATALREAGLTVRDVSDLTGFPEMMDGRVKTLHPRVHGGLLALRDDAGHVAAMDDHGVDPIDLLVVNLYPFEATVARGAGHDETIENIDIGGPAMIRAGAKNHAHVAVVVDPQDYAALLAELDANDGATTWPFRRGLAQTAYARTSAYDAIVSQWLAKEAGVDAPRRITFSGELRQELRYGENPHQRGLFYTMGTDRPGIATARQVQGKALSWNNINDTDAAWELCSEFGGSPACVIVKHANPCGVATGDTLAAAHARAYDCDRTSAFGGIVAVNRPLDEGAAKAIVENFTEVVIAPGADAAARAVFAGKANLRLLLTDGMPDPTDRALSVRQVAGGMLVQDRDAGPAPELTVVTKARPTDAQMADLLFAWSVAKHVKSNAIVYAKDGATVGIGAGQMSRVDSTVLAAGKARDMGRALDLADTPAKGAVVASDAFFPFADGLEAVAEAGAVAVIQPGGSVRDDEVIAAADAAGIAMVFTGVRHFRH